MKSALTLTVLVVVVVASAIVGFRLLTAPFDAELDLEVTCEDRDFEEGDELAAFQVRVNVLNASNREGLAYHQLNALRTAGFAPGYFRNARDLDFDVSAVTIMTESPDHPAVVLVARQFTDDVDYVEPQEGVETDDETVTVLLGQNYDGTVDDPPTSIEVSEPVTWCAADPAEEEEMPEEL